MSDLLLESHKAKGDNFRHIGSIDIDLIVDPNRFGDEEYQTIVELIEEMGWGQSPGKKFAFEKSIQGRDAVYRDITVDFLTLPDQGGGRGCGIGFKA